MEQFLYVAGAALILAGIIGLALYNQRNKAGSICNEVREFYVLNSTHYTYKTLWCDVILDYCEKHNKPITETFKAFPEGFGMKRVTVKPWFSRNLTFRSVLYKV